MATRLVRLICKIRFTEKVILLAPMLHIAFCKVLVLKSSLEVVCIVVKIHNDLHSLTLIEQSAKLQNSWLCINFCEAVLLKW